MSNQHQPGLRLHPWMGWLAVAVCLNAVSSPADTRDGLDFFESKIRPVLVEHCYKCHSHSSEKIKGGLLLDTRDDLLKGGDTGPAIVPGNASASLLIKAVRYADKDLQMPPKDQRLSEQQIANLETWINLGAPDPRVKQVVSAMAKTNHWAFQPLRSITPPLVKNQRWVQTPIDQFILAKLEAKKLLPSLPADKRTLLRRVTYDLTGLPPTPVEMDAFLADRSADAYEKVVDRLLASPHYGERWGRHWLDVARYSDTKGYVYGREERFYVHAHTYRDWVVRSFNEDMPYDRFLLLQIAADQVAPEDAASQAAMGFLTTGRRFLGVTHDIIDDRIDVVMRGTQGLTMGCARCHDHKYDPIPTRDYYSLYGIFQSSLEQIVRIEPASTTGKPRTKFESELRKVQDKLDTTMSAARDEAAERVRNRVADYLNAQFHLSQYPEEGFDQILAKEDVIPAYVRRWHAYLFQTSKRFDPVFAPWHAYAAIPEKEFAMLKSTVCDGLKERVSQLNPLVAEAFSTPPQSMAEVARRYGDLLSRINREWHELSEAAKTNKTSAPVTLGDRSAESLRLVLYGENSPASVPPGDVVNVELYFDTATCENLWKLRGDVDRLIIGSSESPDYALILKDREPDANPRVFIRGNPANKGDEVPRQFPVVLAGTKRHPFTHGSGRLELAEAIANKNNPLTARVMVNRIWLHHFGEGLVRTPSDFGTRCQPPSHPELLDWLAQKFMDDGWSIKKLHRLILLSSAYQQSSDDDAHGAALDPDNRLLWRMNRQRLDFEEMRDTLLSDSGELNARMGGKPDQLFEKPFSTRRTLYGLVDRQYLPGIFRVFDFANPDMHSPERPDTTVPQQALFLMNSPFVQDRARALANRSDIKSTRSLRERVDRLYEILYQRPATSQQAEEGLRFIRTLEQSPVAELKPVISSWSYGYGEYDEAAQRIKTFTPLPHFTEEAWQGGEKWPDDKLGWVQLTADGGHAGNDLQHAAVRRWTAPSDLTISITSTIVHEHKEGDGIRAQLVSSRDGLLGRWVLHNEKAEANFDRIEVHKGDTLDFVVDFRANLNSDDFHWAPVLKVVTTGALDALSWNAEKEFGGQPGAAPQPLTPWEKYAQVLMLSNELMFID